jgi:hypothetical protein
MSVSVLRNSLCWAMVVLCPLSMTAGDTGGAVVQSAVVHSNGGVWVNGSEVAESTTVFPGDVLETKPGSVANLDAEGSSVLIRPESVVKFQGNSLNLEHGSVSVGTSTAMSVHMNCIKVEPTSNKRTEYDATDLSGTVKVAAHKDDVSISQTVALRKATPDSNSSQSSVVHEGEQATRDEAAACGEALRPGGAGNGLNAKWIEIGGGAAGGAVILCLLLCKGPKQSTVSPSQP